jgi:multimeric flavodoxin WrbA
MRAVILNCTLKRSPEPSNTQALADVVATRLRERSATVESFRLADHHIPPGVQTDLGAGDEWPRLHEKLVSSEMLIIATPTWLGRPSSIAQRALERMDAMLSETDEQGRPVAYNRVAGVVVTGNEDGAHHVISEVSGALGDIGYTIPGRSRARSGLHRDRTRPRLVTQDRGDHGGQPVCGGLGTSSAAHTRAQLTFSAS